MNRHYLTLSVLAFGLMSAVPAALAAPTNTSSGGGTTSSTGGTTPPTHTPISHPMFVGGTIASVDTTAGKITITPTNGGTAVVVIVPSTVTIIGHLPLDASQIAVGDRLDVAGIPTTIQAINILDNLMPAPPTPPTPPTTKATTSGTTTTVTTPPPPGAMHVRGVVTSLSPLSLLVGNTLSLVVTVTPGTTVSEVLPVTVKQLVVGEKIGAVVMTSTTGTNTAVQVEVGPPPVATIPAV